LLAVYERGSGAENDWAEKTAAIRVGTLKSSTTMPVWDGPSELQLFGRESVIRYLGVFLGTPSGVAREWEKRTAAAEPPRPRVRRAHDDVVASAFLLERLFAELCLGGYGPKLTICNSRRRQHDDCRSHTSAHQGALKLLSHTPILPNGVSVFPGGSTRTPVLRPSLPRRRPPSPAVFRPPRPRPGLGLRLLFLLLATVLPHGPLRGHR